RDVNWWDRREEFEPERFTNSGNSIDYKRTDFEFIPFGPRRRICPGISMAAITMEMSLLNLIYSFDWKSPMGAQEIETSNSHGAVIHKKNTLQLIVDALLQRFLSLAKCGIETTQILDKEDWSNVLGKLAKHTSLRDILKEQEMKGNYQCSELIPFRDDWCIRGRLESPIEITYAGSLGFGLQGLSLMTDGIKRRRRDQSSDGFRNLETTSGRDRLKVDLESSTWQQRQDYKATSSC
nr:cytochrome P450 [Tanacetum cinerariifolium]